MKLSKEAISKMSENELRDYLNSVYDVSIELIKRRGYYKYYKALGYDYDTNVTAFEVASAINVCPHEAYVMNIIESLWDKAVYETAGISEEEYYENPEAPLWKRKDWRWDEDEEEWEQNEE